MSVEIAGMKCIAFEKECVLFCLLFKGIFSFFALQCQLNYLSNHVESFLLFQLTYDVSNAYFSKSAPIEQYLSSDHVYTENIMEVK